MSNLQRQRRRSERSSNASRISERAATFVTVHSFGGRGSPAF